MDATLPHDPSVEALIAEVERTFGNNAHTTEPEVWITSANELCGRLKDTSKHLLFIGADVIGDRALEGLGLRSNYFEKPWTIVSIATASEGERSALALEWELVSRNDGFGFPAEVTMRLSIGYDWIEPWQWLTERWWRVLELMLLPLGLGVWENDGRPNEEIPRYRGVHVLCRAANYLARNEGGENVTFALEASFRAGDIEDRIRAAATSLLAVHESLRRLRCERAEPDALLEFYLKAKPFLPRSQWRAKTDLSRRIGGR